METMEAEASNQDTDVSQLDDWQLATSRDGLTAPISQFLEVTDVLLQRPQLNSTHLFRADILFDSTHTFTTISDEDSLQDVHNTRSSNASREQPPWPGFSLYRTIVRRLIPRKPQIDRPLEQSCFVLHNDDSDMGQASRVLIMYVPHVESEADVPWYHPKVRAIAYLYSRCSTAPAPTANLSLYYIPFKTTTNPNPVRLERTFISLIETFVRLLKLPSRTSTSSEIPSDNANPPVRYIPTLASTLKDTILPHHTVQNTYSTLKQKYASLLISKWTEKTDPAKHVFEDLGIAAFLIELWKTMYAGSGDGSADGKRKWTGFVDIACGNGVLAWVLCREGWSGWGFDARRRATWDMLATLDAECGWDGEKRIKLEERVCVPRVFLDALEMNAEAAETVLETSVFDGVFEAGTFIVSNHADELTLWTPLLGAMASQKLSWFAIPCCSHALDGGRKRYTLKDVRRNGDGRADEKSKEDERAVTSHSHRCTATNSSDDQGATGDLKALRASKMKAQTHSDDQSMYSCLTRKVETIAQQVGYEVDMSLVRIPSTRNIGIIGGRGNVETDDSQGSGKDLVWAAVTEECASTGGVEVSARMWLEKCKKLRAGQGRGKVNWKGPEKGKYENNALVTASGAS